MVLMKLASPAREHVHVDVAGDTGACAQVHADVQTVRMVGGAQVYFSLAGEPPGASRAGLHRDPAGSRPRRACCPDRRGDHTSAPVLAQQRDRRVVPHLFRPRPPATGNRLLQHSFQLRIARSTAESAKLRRSPLVHI
jgi:hypothetical protein